MFPIRAAPRGTVMDELDVWLPRPRAWNRLIDDDDFKRLSARVLERVRAA